MQSGPIVAVRAVVMLACMIVVPLVAIFWKHWPEAIDLARDGRWSELAHLGVDIVTKSGPQPSTAHAGTQEAPTFAAGGLTNAASAATIEATPANPFSSSAEAPPLLLAGDPAKAPHAGTLPPTVAPAAYQAPVADPAGTPLIGTAIPDPIESPAALPSHLTPGAVQAASSLEQGPQQQNPFRDMEQRLRTLGATYYLLESWGTEGNLYRFHVKMAMAGNPNYNRHFEATDADPLVAMKRVLEEVEAWRSGRPS